MHSPRIDCGLSTPPETPENGGGGRFPLARALCVPPTLVAS